MAKTGLAGIGAKGLDLAGGGGGNKMRWLLVGGLVIIIVGSIILGIKGFVDESRAPDKTGQNASTFECLKCKHQFSPGADRDARIRARIRDEGHGRGIDCPKCKAKQAAHRMMVCPNCKHRFLPAWAGVQPQPGVPRPRDICPKCGTDFMKYYMKKYAERRKQQAK